MQAIFVTLNIFSKKTKKQLFETISIVIRIVEYFIGQMFFIVSDKYKKHHASGNKIFKTVGSKNIFVMFLRFHIDHRLSYPKLLFTYNMYI